MIAAMEITEDTPMTMPSTVRAERTFEERRVPIAARKFSRACAGVITAISQTSRLRSDPAETRAMQDKFQRKALPRSLALLPAAQPRFAPQPGTAYTCAAPGPLETPS